MDFSNFLLRFSSLISEPNLTLKQLSFKREKAENVTAKTPMDKEKGEEDEGSTCLWMLPEGCTAEILSLTSPPDVCRLSLVSPSFRSTADSDTVWAKFLPSDYRSIIAKSASPIPDFRSLKDLYRYLSHHPLLIDEGRKSFSLEKWSGKKCYFLGARNLNIAWADTPGDWEWTSLSESRFPEVAQLKVVWELEIWCTIQAKFLSPLTFYTAYFIYKFKDGYGFDYPPIEVLLEISGVESEKRFAFLHSASEQEYEDYELNARSPKLRDDGWFELEFGAFFTENEDDCIEMRMQEPQSGFRKRGLIVEGIEIRPVVY